MHEAVTGVAESEVSLHRYTRRAQVEDEISSLPSGSDINFRLAVIQATAPETVVYGIRRLRRAGDNGAADALSELLLELAAPILDRAAKKQFPHSYDDCQEVMQQAAVQLWREVIDTSSKEEFWEVNFKHMVIRACSDAARSIRDKRKRESRFYRSDDGIRDDELRVPDPAFLDREDHAFLDDVVLGDAFSQLEGNIRTAIYLKARGLKIDSKNANEPTISSVLGVTGRTVQTYLREGEAILRQALER